GLGQQRLTIDPTKGILGELQPRADKGRPIEGPGHTFLFLGNRKGNEPTGLPASALKLRLASGDDFWDRLLSMGGGRFYRLMERRLAWQVQTIRCTPGAAWPATPGRAESQARLRALLEERLELSFACPFVLDTSKAALSTRVLAVT